MAASALYDVTNEEQANTRARPRSFLEGIGAAVRIRSGVHPIYVSQGHRISLGSAVQCTLLVTDGLRIPRPTRDADLLAAETKRAFLATHASEN